MREAYFKVFPGEWRKDLGAQSLSYHDKGVWFELCCILHGSPQRGKLINPEGKPCPDDLIARLLGLSLHDTTASLKRLIGSGLAARDVQGALICPAMIREEHIRQVRKEAGVKGGNPLLNQIGCTEDNQNSLCTVLSTEVWLKELQGEAAYKGLDVHLEASKAQMWVKQNNRVFTKRFFINWLNKQPTPLHVEEKNGEVVKKPPSVLDLKTVINAKQSMADDLKNRYAADLPLGTEWSDRNKKQEWLKLRAEIRDLNLKLASSL